MNMDEVVFQISGNTILSLVALIGAIIALIVYMTKGVHWFDSVSGAKDALETYKKDAKTRMTEIERKHDADIMSIKEEQQVIIYALLACLKATQGEDDQVKMAIDKLEKHLNMTAHK